MKNITNIRDASKLTSFETYRTWNVREIKLQTSYELLVHNDEKLPVMWVMGRALETCCPSFGDLSDVCDDFAKINKNYAQSV